MTESNREIERRFLVSVLPEDLERYPSKHFEQGYLWTEPALRIRREEDEYVFTCKGRGLLVREEYNLPVPKEAFFHLIQKADGVIIKKTRYFIPESGGLCIELDVFSGELAPLVIAEVEFPTEEAAARYTPPGWFGEEVTENRAYSNSVMSREGLPRDFMAK